MAEGLGGFKVGIEPDYAAVEKLKRELLLSERIAKSVGQTIARELTGGFDEATRATQRQQNEVEKLGNRIKRLGDNITLKLGTNDAKRQLAQLSSYGRSLFGNMLKGVFQGAGQELFRAASRAVRGLASSAINRDELKSYDSARAKVSTLSSDVPGAQKVALQVAKDTQYTISQTEALAASYDVLSAGFSKTSDSLNILTASQKGALGGMSDLNTVSNATTSILNAYELSAASADRVVNQMIGTQNAGKIVVGEYAQMIGQVATTAASAGVPLSELNSLIATSTAKGVPAESAIRGVRQAIAALSKPSSIARKEAERLGIQWDAAALRSKGFSGLLSELSAKNGDTTESMVKLFGSVEAVTAIMPSAGEGLAKFQKNIQTIKNTSADDAFNKMANSIENVGKRNQVLRQELALKFQTATSPVFEAMNQAMSALLQSMNEGGILFDLLNTQASRFRDYLAQNPEVIQQMIAGVQQLAQDGIDLLASGVQRVTEMLRQNPTLLQDMVANLAAAAQAAVDFSAGFVEGLQSVGQFVQPIADLASGLVGASTESSSLATNLGQAAAYLGTFSIAAGVFSTIATVVGTITSGVGGLIALFGKKAIIIAGIKAGVVAVKGALIAVGAAAAPVLAVFGAVAIWVYNIIEYTKRWDDLVLGAKQTVKDVESAIGEVLAAIFPINKETFSFKAIWEQVNRLVGNCLNPLGQVFKHVDNLVQKTGIFRDQWNGLKKIAKDVGDAFNKFVGGVLTGLLEKAKGLWETMKGMVGLGDNNVGPGVVGNGQGTGSADQFVGAVLSILEAPTRQGRVDVAQVLANRVGTNFNSYGSNIRDQAFAPGQFQPFFKNTYGIGKGDIQDRSSAIAALGKAGYSIKKAEQALDNFFADVTNMTRVADSRSKVGGRAYFKGVSQYKNMRSSDFLRNRGENFFHHEDGDRRNRKVGSIEQLFRGAGIAGGAIQPMRASMGGIASPLAGKSIQSVVNYQQSRGQDFDAYRAYRRSYHGGVDFDARIGGGAGGGVQAVTGGVIKGIRGFANSAEGALASMQVVVETMDDAGRKVETRYNHLSKNSIQRLGLRVGQQVQPGQQLGKVGPTDSVSSGAHLDFKVLVNGQFVNPDQFLKLGGAAGRLQSLNLSTGSKGSVQVGSLSGSARSNPYVTATNNALPSPRTNSNAPLDNTVANKAREAANTAEAQAREAQRQKEKETQAMLQAVAEARRAEDAKAALARESLEAERKQKRQEQKAKLDAMAAKLTSPIAKAALAQKTQAMDVGGAFDDRVYNYQLKREDLVKARDRKLQDLKSPDEKTANAAKLLPDFSAQINAYDQLIKKEQQLKATALETLNTAYNTTEAERARLGTQQRRQQNEAQIYDNLKAQLELKKQQASIADPKRELELGFIIQKVDLERQRNQELSTHIKKQQELKSALAQLATIGADKGPAASNLNTALKETQQIIDQIRERSNVKLELISAEQTKAIDAFNLKQKEALLLKDQIMLKSRTDVMSKAANEMKAVGNEFEASKMQREVALQQEALRYRQQMLEIERQVADLRSRGVQVSESEVLTLQRQAEVTNKLNVRRIQEQFKGLKGQLADTAKQGFGQFFRDLITGSKSAGDAFKSFAESILSKLADMAVNSLLSNLFGGAFGGGGGGLLGGLFGAAGGTVENNATGNLGAIESAFARERTQSGGFKPKLAVVNDREAILNARQTRRFYELGLNRVVNYADGNVGSAGGGAKTNSGDININVPITINNGSGDNMQLDPTRLRSGIKALVQEQINENRRQGNALAAR